jgi:hypothetical protein
VWILKQYQLQFLCPSIIRTDSKTGLCLRQRAAVAVAAAAAAAAVKRRKKGFPLLENPRCLEIKYSLLITFSFLYLGRISNRWQHEETTEDQKLRIKSLWEHLGVLHIVLPVLDMI